MWRPGSCPRRPRAPELELTDARRFNQAWERRRRCGCASPTDPWSRREVTAAPVGSSTSAPKEQAAATHSAALGSATPSPRKTRPDDHVHQGRRGRINAANYAPTRPARPGRRDRGRLGWTATPSGRDLVRAKTIGGAGTAKGQPPRPRFTQRSNTGPRHQRTKALTVARSSPRPASRAGKPSAPARRCQPRCRARK